MDRLHWRIQGSTSSPTGINSRRRVVCGLSQREICAYFNEGNLAQFGRSAEKYVLWSYVVKFEFSRPKGSTYTDAISATFKSTFIAQSCQRSPNMPSF